MPDDGLPVVEEERIRLVARLRELARTEAETARVLRELAQTTHDPEIAARRRREADEADRASVEAAERADRLAR